MNQAQRQRLTELISQPIDWQARLDRYTSLGIGGPADAVVTVDRHNEMQALLVFLAEENIAWRLIGRGTNLLVRDEGFAGVIILLGAAFRTVQRQPGENSDTVLLRAGAGYSLGRLSLQCIDWQLTGLEFACGIPGSLGGAVIMNAGAWGSDMASMVRSIKLITAEGDKKLCRRELDFSYRCCNGLAAYQRKAVVAEVELELTKGNGSVIRQYCNELQSRRKQAQFCRYPNAGSFFKNPPNDSAGRLIDASRLKGTVIGGAMISEHHGNFFVNKGGATAEDVLKLMQLVQTKVKIDSGVALEPEVHFI